MNVFSIYLRVIRRLNSPIKNIKSWYRLLRFRLQAQLNGGQIVMGKNVKFEHRVIFQGKGKVLISDDVIFGYKFGTSPTHPILLQPRENESIIEIGKGCTLVNGTEIVARNRVSIGNQCLIGARCVILDADIHSLRIKDGKRGTGKIAPVIIGENVWLGLSVTVLKGVTIGNEAVIGACSVVTKDIPAGRFAAGNPAKVIGFSQSD